jgi:hypothetical protein
VVEFLSDNAAAVTLILAGLCLLMVVMVQSLQISRLRTRIDQLTGGVEGGDLEAVLGQHLETVHQVGRDLDELTARTAILESAARHHFAKEGLVRFNPFPDTGGNQSFAMALLDESDNGFVLSSLHSRTGTRIYAKAVEMGKSDGSLSTEEQEAIDIARTKRTARPATPPRSAAAARAVPPVTAPADAVPGRPAAPPAKPGPSAARSPVRKAAPAPKMPHAAPDAAADEATSQASGELAKTKDELQAKPRNLSSPEIAAQADAEKVGRKPGLPPVARPKKK